MPQYHMLSYSMPSLFIQTRLVKGQYLLAASHDYGFEPTLGPLTLSPPP